MTNALCVSAVSIVSIIESSVTSASTIREAGLPGRLAHCDTGLFGSASIMITVPPRSANMVARSTAEVDFPAPPLGLANTMVGMGDSAGKRQGYQIAFR